MSIVKSNLFLVTVLIRIVGGLELDGRTVVFDKNPYR